MTRTTLAPVLAFAWFLAAAPLAAETPVDFAREIRPILSDRCAFCHGPDEAQRQADLRLDTRTGILADRDGSIAVVPGKPEESVLIHRIKAENPDERMPPSDSKRSLSPREIELIERWIREGAKWEDHWSFSPPVRPARPTVQRADWPRNEIDWFILARLEAAGLTPSPEASRETLLRRVTLDLTGLPPSIAELDAFLADESPDAYERAVDRLLESPRYGEHMATNWLDIARYSDSNGYQGERTRTLWPWRDWVIRAMNDNMPFDRFTIEQLAGDLLPEPTRDQLIATGFQRNHMLNGEGGRIAEESRVDYVIDRVNTTATTWLGLTMACAQCHDHKYDPISQRDFYAMYAFYNSIDETGAVDRGGNANPVMSLPTDEQLARERELETELAARRTALQQATSAEKLTAWETRFREKLKDPSRRSYWQPLAPTTAASKNGQTLEIRSDASVFVSGENPNTDTYTLSFAPPAGTYLGLRLDALKHESFTNGGLARSDSGNFVLTEIALELTNPGEEAAPIKIASAQASFEQGGFPIANTFDGKPNTGWAVHNPADMKHDRSAVFVFAEPVKVPAESRLTITLSHDSPHVNHNLGWFRLSLTSESAPKLDGSNDPPAEVLAALDVSPGERTAEQTAKLNEYFRQTDPEVVAHQLKFDQSQKRLADHRNSYLQTMVMKELPKSRETYRLIRGTWDNPDKSQLIEPGVPAILPGLNNEARASRLSLARWLVSAENPLTPRVTVNRYWQQFFGTGLVKTPEDFGSQGELPSHPELLDWLAVEFVENGWNVKEIQKQIVLSAAYRQSSRVTPELLAVDPENRLISRGARLRLTSQQIRDQALALSGLLVERIGGPPVKPYQPPGVWLDLTLGKIDYDQDHGEALYRRSVYIFWRRSVGPTMLFDTPARQVCTVKQPRTNTPLQALTLMNDITYAEAARKLAERVLNSGETDDASRLALAFRMATSRHPTEREAQTLRALLEDVRKSIRETPAAIDEFLSVGESLTDANLPRAEIVAFAVVMNAILNLDEVLTNE